VDVDFRCAVVPRTENGVFMATLRELQCVIEAGMRRGESFSTIDDEVIEPSRLSDEEKSALWLYAWSFMDWRAQRREALAHLSQIATRRRTAAP